MLFHYNITQEGDMLCGTPRQVRSNLEQLCCMPTFRVEVLILNQDPIGNLWGAIISIKLGLISIISFCTWVVKIKFYVSWFLRLVSM